MTTWTVKRYLNALEQLGIELKQVKRSMKLSQNDY